MKGLLELKLNKGKLTLGELELQGVMHYEPRSSSDMYKGTAKLDLEMLVNFSNSDNKPTQNL